MSISSFVLVQSATGERVHRAGCAKIPASAISILTLDSIAEVRGDLRPLAVATLASCCKPNAAKLYIDELLAEPSIQDQLVERETELHAELAVEEAEAELEQAQTELVEQELTAKPAPAKPVADSPLAGVKVSKHYHDALIKVVLPMLKRPEELTEVAAEAFAALGQWRRADADYKALPSQDTGWVTSDRYAWERDFLIGYAQQLTGQRAKATYAKEGNLAARRGAAAAKAARSGLI